MSEHLKTETDGAVTVLTINDPPWNVMSISRAARLRDISAFWSTSVGSLQLIDQRQRLDAPPPQAAD